MLLTGAFALVFFWAPNDADQGFIQKIFYLHVPLAIVALGGFVAGGIYGDAATCARATARDDLRSYVAIHMSLIFGVGALVTGSIWAKASWGVWWVWDEPTLVVLPDRLPALRLLLAAALLDRGPRAPGALRGGVRDRRRRLRAAELHGGAARRRRYTHPRALGHAAMPGDMLLTFLLCLVAMALLFVTLCKYELTAKHASMRLRATASASSAGDDGALRPLGGPQRAPRSSDARASRSTTPASTSRRPTLSSSA